jgi:hypothetical protein
MLRANLFDRRINNTALRTEILHTLDFGLNLCVGGLLPTLTLPNDLSSVSHIS